MADSPDPSRSFFVSAGETTEGPFDLATLRDQVASGRINDRYQIWDEDAGNWAPISKLEELVRPRIETSNRVRPVRAPKSPSNPMWDPSAAASSGRANSPEAQSLKTIVPRVVSQRIGGTFAPESLAPERPDQPAEQEPKPTVAPEPAPSPRRRNYSPMNAGANAVRPFAPVKEEEEQANPAPAFEPTVHAPQEPPVERLPIWPLASVCVGVCLLGLLALWIAGFVTFGLRAREDKLRLTNELAAAQKALAVKSQGLKHVLTEKQDYIKRFEAAQVAVRNMRVSVFASTRRQLQVGDAPEIDQRLFELDQLNRLVPEDAAEQKIRHELTDAFFSRHGAPKSPPPEPLASPAP